ncbi:MAG: hypothetical protein IPI30_15260 [Saprospiraceae bacterium]|nr:hypothetical protein [Candidatus Vicinibacter affinis]
MQKSVPVPTQEEFQNIFSSPSKINKHPSRKPTSQSRCNVLLTLAYKVDREEHQMVTRVWQKWWFSAPQTPLWLMNVWFSASTFVVKIATFAKPETVMQV